MRTALEKLLNAIEIEQDKNNKKRIEFFSFKYGNTQLDFLGHYYAYVYKDGIHGEDEYCWNNYDEMLDSTIRQTGKSIREMTSELKEIDLDLRF